MEFNKEKHVKMKLEFNQCIYYNIALNRQIC